MDKLIGKKVAHYYIEKFVGKGKTGFVYKARDLNLDRAVAVKFLAPELAMHPGIQQQLAQAARAISPLTHPSIVAVYDFGKQNGRAYIVTDYVNGIGLDQAILRLNAHNQFMPFDETVHIAAQVAAGLGTAHQEGTLHLNLKPSNILVKRHDRTTRHGESSLRAMLTDFGLSLIPESGIQTSFIDLGNNFAYMSPEQCTNGKIDGRSDVYSLGVILYQLLAGRVPFDVNTSTEAIMRHAVESPIPLADIRPSVPANIAHIVHTALAKDPAQRYQLAEHMADALRKSSYSLTTEPQPTTTRVLSQEASSQPAKAASKPDIPVTSTGTAGLREILHQEVPPSSKPPQSEIPFMPSTFTHSETIPVESQFDTPVFSASEKTSPKQTKPTTAKTPSTKPIVSLHPFDLSNKPEWLDIPDDFLIPTPTPEKVAFTPEELAPPAKTPSPRANKPSGIIEEPLTEVHEQIKPDLDTKIVIIRQGRNPRQEPINKPLIRIGRAQDNDIVLNAPDVSRYHMRLEWANDHWQVTDLDSSAGTFWNGRRLAANQPEAWLPEHIVQIGAYFLHWASAGELTYDIRVNEEPKTELFQIPEDASQIQSSNGRFSVAMHPALVTLMAGEQTTSQIELFNQGPTTDTIKLAIRGLPSGTFTLTQHFVTLAPGARAMIPLVMHLPAPGTLMSYRISAGNYPFEMLVHSKTIEGETAVISGMLIVSTVETFSIGIWPSSVDNGNNIRILIRNEGNVSNAYSIVGREEKGRVQFGGQRGRVQLKPGEAITQVVTVRTREQPLFGREHDIPFEVEVRTENGQQKVKTGHLKVKPQVPKWAVILGTILVTLLLIVLIATAMLNQGQTQINTPSPPDVTPASLPISDSIETEHINTR